MKTRRLPLLFATAFTMAYGNISATDEPGKPASISFQEVENSIIFYGERKIYPSNIRMDIINTYLKEFRKNPDTYIKITSHTNDEGDWENSLDISRKRAIAIAEHFRKYGVPQDRIILDWLGDDVPQFFSEEDKHKNRRTNIKIIKKVKYYPNEVMAKVTPSKKEHTPSPILASHTPSDKKEVAVTPIHNKVHKKINQPVEEKIAPASQVEQNTPTKSITKQPTIVAKKEIPFPKKTVKKETKTIAKKEMRRVAKESPEEKTMRRVAKPINIASTTLSEKEEFTAKGGQILPQKTIVFIDSSTNLPVQVEVDMMTYTGKASVSTSDKGELKMDLNTLEKDFIDIYAYGYFFKSAKIEFNGERQTVLLQPTDKGEKIELNNLQFVAGKSMLLKESNAELERLYLSLMMNPDSKVEIGGHINVPNKSMDELTIRQMQLSVDRAKSVYDFLVKKGISRKRLTYKGYGNSEMIFANPKDDKEKSRNRRVEVKILN